VAVRREKGKVDLTVALKGLEGVRGKTGYFETAKYEDGTPVAYVATIQEFGYKSIPPRPTMRPTADEHGKPGGKWAKQFGAGAKAVLNGKATAIQVMETLALSAAGDVAKAIAATHAPPLSPLTLLARLYKSDMGSKVPGGKTLGRLAKSLDAGPPNLAGLVSIKPLVDTGLMFQSVTGIAEKTGPDAGAATPSDPK